MSNTWAISLLCIIISAYLIYFLYNSFIKDKFDKNTYYIILVNILSYCCCDIFRNFAGLTEYATNTRLILCLLKYINILAILTTYLAYFFKKTTTMKDNTARTILLSLNVVSIVADCILLYFNLPTVGISIFGIVSAAYYFAYFVPRYHLYKDKTLFFASVLACVAFVLYFLNIKAFVCISLLAPVFILVTSEHALIKTRGSDALDRESFEIYLKELQNDDTPLNFVCLNFGDLSQLNKNFFDQIISCFVYKYIFNYSSNTILLVGKKEQQINIEFITQKLANLNLKHANIIIFNHISKANISDASDFDFYYDYYSSEANLPFISIITDEDLKHTAYRPRKIYEALIDICDKNDLGDERVKVYCQPIKNIKRNCFDSAEALMRLELPGLGIIYPNEFIPLAEKNGLLHPLSLIIVNKVSNTVNNICKTYHLKRISVNFSIQEIETIGFYKELETIIQQNNLPSNKIAIELTETGKEYNISSLKQELLGAKENHIKLYLDDFGTGYSNFDRIFDLNLDIVKFDKSLVDSLNNSAEREFMIKSFVDVFHKYGYKVLFEGVETEEVEKLCISLGVDYLQGYYYSKPIPISKLTKYLCKKQA